MAGDSVGARRRPAACRQTALQPRTPADRRPAPTRRPARDPRAGLDRCSAQRHGQDRPALPGRLRRPARRRASRSRPPGALLPPVQPRRLGRGQGCRAHRRGAGHPGALGADGLDFPSLAEDIALEARLVLQLTDEVHEIGERIAVIYRELRPRGHRALGAGGRTDPCCADPRAAGRRRPLREPRQRALLRGPRAARGLLRGRDTQWRADQGRRRLPARGALPRRQRGRRKSDPTLAARYHRLMVAGGKHHSSALCTVAAVLLTRIATCLRSGRPYELRDVDGRAITPPRAAHLRRSLHRARARESRAAVAATASDAQRQGRVGPDRSRWALQDHTRPRDSMNLVEIASRVDSAWELNGHEWQAQLH